MVGRQFCGLLHRSARTGRNQGNAAFLPRAFAPAAVRLKLVRSWHKPAVGGWAEHVRSARVFQTSTCSAIARASSTSIPRYLKVLSILVWPSRSWTAPCLLRLLPAGAVAGWDLHPREKRRLVTAHTRSGLWAHRPASTMLGLTRATTKSQSTLLPKLHSAQSGLEYLSGLT